MEDSSGSGLSSLSANSRLTGDGSWEPEALIALVVLAAAPTLLVCVGDWVSRSCEG